MQGRYCSSSEDFGDGHLIGYEVDSNMSLENDIEINGRTSPGLVGRFTSPGDVWNRRPVFVLSLVQIFWCPAVRSLSACGWFGDVFFFRLFAALYLVRSYVFWYSY